MAILTFRCAPVLNKFVQPRILELFFSPLISFSTEDLEMVLIRSSLPVNFSWGEQLLHLIKAAHLRFNHFLLALNRSPLGMIVFTHTALLQDNCSFAHGDLKKNDNNTKNKIR